MTTPASIEQRAATGDQLLVTLAGVAEIAQVSRPVASMWRTRFAAGADPFPTPVARRQGADVFEATQVAEWLARTGHGNNPDVVADAAVAALPGDCVLSDEQTLAEIEALIALHAHSGSLVGRADEELGATAVNLDPEDVFLRSEVAAHLRRGARWLGYVDRLVDAAYSPSGALRIIARRGATSTASAGSAGRLVGGAVELVCALVEALRGTGERSIRLDAHDPELSAALASVAGDAATLHLPPASEARSVRRRLATDGFWLGDVGASGSITVARLPAHREDDSASMLRRLDEVALALTDHDVAIVIGPARVLTDELTSADEGLRADALRTGRVRGIVRLGPGLVESAPREVLAVWVLGAAGADVPIAERFTAVADLSATPLAGATPADLVSDLVTSLGGARDVRARAFRFARFVRTGQLVARGGSLVPAAQLAVAEVPSAAEIPALLDAAAQRILADMAPVPVSVGSSKALTPSTVASLIEEGHLQRIAGTRIDRDLFGTSGLTVVTADDLDDPAAIGRVRVDQLAFAARHANAALTRPGDVIVRTSPTAAAWVDVDGSKIVASPARMLRITAGDPGGLVPEVIAADIAGAGAGPGAWKRWVLRRVAPPSIDPLRAALAEVEAAKAALVSRIDALDSYAQLVVAGATSGAITLSPTSLAADAAAQQ